MTTVNELTGLWLKLLEMAEDPDMDQEAIAEAFDQIEGDVEYKAEGMAMIRTELLNNAEACRKEADRLLKRARSFENNAGTILSRVEYLMRFTNKLKFKTTKTVSSDRYIQAPGFVVEKIRSQGYVTEMTPAAISDAFRKLVVKLDLTGMRFHDLRHWGASYRHSLGIPNAAIQKDGGWSNEATLTNIYRHVLDDERVKYSEKINKAFQDLMT